MILFECDKEFYQIFIQLSGRAAQSSHWDGESGYRVHVSDLAAGISRKEIEKVFTKFGTVNEVISHFELGQV